MVLGLATLVEDIQGILLIVRLLEVLPSQCEVLFFHEGFLDLSIDRAAFLTGSLLRWLSAPQAFLIGDQLSEGYPLLS